MQQLNESAVYMARIRGLVRETMERWAAQPCECAARAARTEFPLKPEHVKCQSCTAKGGLENLNKEEDRQ